MAKLIEGFTPEFELGDIVSFHHEDKRLVGEIVRVYNSGDLYHVEVKGQRYQVDATGDDIQSHEDED